MLSYQLLTYLLERIDILTREKRQLAELCDRLYRGELTENVEPNRFSVGRAA